MFAALGKHIEGAEEFDITGGVLGMKTICLTAFSKKEKDECGSFRQVDSDSLTFMCTLIRYPCGIKFSADFLRVRCSVLSMLVCLLIAAVEIWLQISI